MKLIKLHILPRVKELYDQEDRKIVLGDNFDSYATSLAEYVKLVKPNLLIEHELDGNSYGRIESIENTEAGVFAIASVNDPAVLKGKRFASPRIRWNHTDIHGRRWPAALLETSLVSVPRFMIGQEEIESINSMTYGNVLNDDAKLSEVNLEGLQLPIEELEQPQEELMLTPEMIEQIKLIVKEAMMETEAVEEADEIAQEAEAAATGEAPVTEASYTKMGETEMVGEEAPAPAIGVAAEEETVEVIELQDLEETEPATMAARMSRMSMKGKDELLVKLAEAMYAKKKESVMSAIRADLKDRLISEDRDVDFYEVYLANKTAYLSTMSALGKPASRVASIKPSRSTPVADSVMSGVSNLSPIERALADSKAGKGSFVDLMNKYSR